MSVESGSDLHVLCEAQTEKVINGRIGNSSPKRRNQFLNTDTAAAYRSNHTSDSKHLRAGSHSHHRSHYDRHACPEHDEDNDNSCDSCSELTEQFYKHLKPPVINLSVPVHVKTFRPVVRFQLDEMDTDGSDSNTNKLDISADLNKLSRKGTGSLRYTQPRLSLLGKPISYKLHRRDLRYRRLQAKIYNFLERPKDWYAVFYHIAICAICIGALVLSTLSTIKGFEPTMSSLVMYMEPLLLLWLLVEYSIRIWASGCRSRYQGCQGRMRFAQRPLCIVDAVIILSTCIVILVGSTSDMFAASTLRGLRFFQILRMVRMDRRAGTWKLLGSVVWAHRRELLTTLYIGFLGLLFSSYLVYLAEKDYNTTRFGTYADALWWGVVTLCTVGYGDVVPTTWGGKLIASFSAILGIAFFALPAGILGSGFALKVQQQQRQKHLIRRRVPAALLIQSLWRCYAADEHSMSIATWKPHMIPCPSPTQDRQFSAKNTSFVSRFSTRRKDRGGMSSSSGNNSGNSNNNTSTASTNNNGGNTSPHSPMITRRESKKPTNCSEEDVPETLQSFVNRTWSHLSLATGLVDQRVDRMSVMKDPNPLPGNCSGKMDQSEEELDLSPKIRDLNYTDKTAIRALRKIKYFVARKKFREALRPYDVKDVIEQYSAGHVDMLGRVKSLQCRLDQILGKSGSKNKDVYDSKVSLSSRIVKVERQVEDIESKLDLLIDLYKEDRKILLQPKSPSIDKSFQNESGGLHLKPRSILVDKQYTSEPSSPIYHDKHPKKIMIRNHSDLSTRIRKRVTYRLHSASAPLRHFGEPVKYEDSDVFNTVESDYIDIKDSVSNTTNLSSTSSIRSISKEDIAEESIPNDVFEPDGEHPAGSNPEMENVTDNLTHSSSAFDVRKLRRESPVGFNTVTASVSSSSSNERDKHGKITHNDPIENDDDDAVDSDDESDETDRLLNGSDTERSLKTHTFSNHLVNAPRYPPQECKIKIDRADSNDHVVLMPLGTIQALKADSSDV